MNFAQNVTKLKLVRFSKSTSNTVTRIIVFFFMAFSMVFFFANSVSDAFYLITHLFQGIHFDTSDFSFIENKLKFLLAIFFFIIIFIIQIFNEREKFAIKIFEHAHLHSMGMLYYLYCSYFPHVFRSSERILLYEVLRLF